MTDCATCHKDFCPCVKQHTGGGTDYRKLNTVKLLNKHGIAFGFTKTRGIVEVFAGETRHLLSLVSETSSRPGDRLVKYRRDGHPWQQGFFSEFLKGLKPWATKKSNTGQAEK